ncbi:hypothetical protein [Luteimonas suaedae]|uniref:hypothetical protein n=1 Tax=Luteimonas suaedae TaxID=2605430 RepID=UPI0011EFE338|nr:hypothetical protein [Luteimonas suaedae]
MAEAGHVAGIARMARSYEKAAGASSDSDLQVPATAVHRDHQQPPESDEGEREREQRTIGPKRNVIQSAKPIR